MSKKTTKRLNLNAEIVRTLHDAELGFVHGGQPPGQQGPQGGGGNTARPCPSVIDGCPSTPHQCPTSPTR